MTVERVYEPSPRRVAPSSISLALAPDHIALIVVALLGVLGAVGAGAAGMIPGIDGRALAAKMSPRNLLHIDL